MNASLPQSSAYRIGMIVPSSNITMEREIPLLLQHLRSSRSVRFTFHSSRLRLRQVTPDELHRMNDSAGEAVDTLTDAQVDSLMYACLVATMFGGKKSVTAVEQSLAARAQLAGSQATVVSSAGALVAALNALNAKRVSMITPYKKELTNRVANTLREYGIEVVQTYSREISDNAAVGRLDQEELLAIAASLDLSDSDALIISACVQMPSLDVIHKAEKRFGLPVLSAATASAYALLTSLGLEPAIPHAGKLLMMNQTVYSHETYQY